MSRIEYNEMDDTASMLRGYAWEANTTRAINGRRGQALLRELEVALVALPSQQLVSGDLVLDDGGCALGALAVHRTMLTGLTRDEATAHVAAAMLVPPGDEFSHPSECTLDFAEAGLKMRRVLAWAIMEVNDEDCMMMTPEQRYEAVLAWVRGQITAEEA